MLKYLKLQEPNPQEVGEVEEDLVPEAETEKEVIQVEVEETETQEADLLEEDHLYQEKKVAVVLQEKEAQKEVALLLKGDLMLQLKGKEKIRISFFQPQNL